jgi:hypothetical protein
MQTAKTNQRIRWIRRAVIFVLLSAMTCYLLIGLFRSAFSFSQLPPDEPFSSRKWIAAKDIGRDNPRVAMVEDLRETYLKVGLKAQAVSKILGKPDQVDEPSLFGNDQQLQGAAKVWSYRIGAWSGFRIDTDYFAIAFDKGGRLLRTWTWQS